MWKSCGFLLLAAALSGSVGCATTRSSSDVLKTPAQSRCEEIGLRGCPEMADGVVAFVDGDRPTAMHKITRASNQNSPAQLREYAGRLQTLSELPGATNYRIRVNELATILVAQSLAVHTNAPQPPAAPHTEAQRSSAQDPTVEEAQRVRDRMLLVLTAAQDPERFTTETVLVSSIGKACELGGNPGVCSARRAGPMIVTDVVASAGCPDQLLLGAGVQDTSILKWWVEARAPGIHGANLMVAASEWLQVVQLQTGKQLSTDRRCTVTWSGYQPRLMPGLEPP